MDLEHVNKENYEQTINNGLVLTDYFATWCGPCKALAPELQKLAEIVGDKCKVVKVDVDDFEDECRGLRIMTVPTIILFENGKEVLRINGYRTKDSLLSEIEPYLK